MVLVFCLLWCTSCSSHGQGPANATELPDNRAVPAKGFLSISLTNLPAPSFSHRFWMEGRVELKSRKAPPAGSVAYLARFQAGDSMVFLVAGYDFSMHRIQCALLDSAALVRWGNGEPAALLASKQVNIVPVENHLYFKLLWNWDRHLVRFEVNGVPMMVPFAYGKNQLTGVGFVNRLPSARVQPPRLQGD